LRDGLVRVKNGGPEPLKLGGQVFLVEETPGGVLRPFSRIEVQVGDRLKWISHGGSSRVLIRRLDPDGASLDRYNPMAHWKKDILESEISEKLRQKTGSGKINGLELVQNTAGRVLELIVRDGDQRLHRFTGMRIRHFLGLKDNVFGLIEVGKAPERRWVAYGRGWGHGVGMDQTGAYGFALEGWTYDQILKHYYNGIDLKVVE